MVTGGQWYGMVTGGDCLEWLLVVNGMEWLPGVTVWNGYRG